VTKEGGAYLLELYYTGTDMPDQSSLEGMIENIIDKYSLNNALQYWTVCTKSVISLYVTT